MNEFYVLQNEIEISYKNVTIPYYLLQLQNFAYSIVRELLQTKERNKPLVHETVG